MPNGHGGVSRYGSALMLVVVLLLVYAYSRKEGLEWIAYAGYVLAPAFGWRFAHGLHLWKVTEYDGAYSSGEAINSAVWKYLVGSVAYGLAAMAAWYFLTGL
jgi:hypothetical protein